jgi:hypothetical protein
VEIHGWNGLIEKEERRGHYRSIPKSMILQGIEAQASKEMFILNSIILTGI